MLHNVYKAFIYMNVMNAATDQELIKAAKTARRIVVILSTDILCDYPDRRYVKEENTERRRPRDDSNRPLLGSKPFST